MKTNQIKPNYTNLEIDTIRLTKGCPKACTHCSQDPKKRLKYISIKQFESNIDELLKLEKQTNNELISNYVLTTTDSDPFLHPELAEAVNIFYEKTGKKFYLLTSGWYLRERFQKNADIIANNYESIEKIALTLSNYPTNPTSIFENAKIFTNVINTFGSLPDNKFIISPQYTAEVNNEHIHSRKQVMDLLEYTIEQSNFSKNDFVGKIHERPIIGLGRANEVLGVKNITDYRIEAENPLPIISNREIERPYSGILDMNGDILILESKRAILNRDLNGYKKLNIFDN